MTEGASARRSSILLLLFRNEAKGNSKLRDLSGRAIDKQRIDGEKKFYYPPSSLKIAPLHVCTPSGPPFLRVITVLRKYGFHPNLGIIWRIHAVR